MRDHNLTLLLKGGQQVKVDGDNRLGIQSDTPWLVDTVGTREWNINADEVLAKFQSGKYFIYNARFIVGEWGSKYNAEKDVQWIIPLGNVVAIRLDGRVKDAQ